MSLPLLCDGEKAARGEFEAIISIKLNDVQIFNIVQMLNGYDGRKFIGKEN